MLSSFINDIDKSNLFKGVKNLGLELVLNDLRFKFPTLFNLNTSLFSGFNSIINLFFFIIHN